MKKPREPFIVLAAILAIAVIVLAAHVLGIET